MNDSGFVIAVFVILGAFSIFYFYRARRTCHGCENPGLRKTGRSKLYEDGEQEEYKCTYCGAQEWKATLFAPSETWKSTKQTEAWRNVSNQIGADFVEELPNSTFLFKLLRLGKKETRIRVRLNGWMITLSAVKEYRGRPGSYGGGGTVEWTLLDAPYVSKDGFEFLIYPTGAWSEIGTLFGGQDVKLGYPEVDRDFIVKCNDEAKVRALFGNPQIRQLIHAHPSFERFGAGSYEGKYEVYFRRIGIITDFEGLMAHVELFAVTLNQLVAIESASAEAPNVRRKE